MSGRKPAVLSTGIRPDDFKHLPFKADIRKKLNLPVDAFLVLFIGNLLLQKGVRDLAVAFKRLDIPNKRLVYVGDGPDKATGNHIDNFGDRQYHEIPDFLAAADVLVLPSHHEGLGQVILEAGAAGVPVIGSATGGITDLLSDSRGWLCAPKTPAALTDCITSVYQNPEEGKRRAGRLFRHVIDDHDLWKNTSRLVKIYQSLCHR